MKYYLLKHNYRVKENNKEFIFVQFFRHYNFEILLFFNKICVLKSIKRY